MDLGIVLLSYQYVVPHPGGFDRLQFSGLGSGLGLGWIALFRCPACWRCHRDDWQSLAPGRLLCTTNGWWLLSLVCIETLPGY